MAKSNITPQTYFENQKIKYTTSLKLIRKRSREMSLLRVVVFIVSIIGIYISVANGYKLTAILFASGLVLFVYLVRVHAGIEKKKGWHEIMLQLIDNELNIIAGNTIHLDTGNEFLHDLHPYNEDLDIFGSRSLFQLINRTATSNGRTLLAGRLNVLTTDTDVLIDRQQAISELRAKPQLRLNFQATGNIFREHQNDQQGLLNWAQSNNTKFDTIFYRIMLIINPLLGFAILALIYLNILTISGFLLFLVIPLVLIGTKMSILNNVHVLVSKKSELLLKYAGLFSIITNEEFTSILLKNIKQNIVGDHSAHSAIVGLSKITKAMDYRLNILVGIFLNIFFLWDIRQVIRLERWKKKYSSYMKEWFDNLSQLDELQSFAGFAFNFPKAVFPEFKKGDFSITATNVTHPSIAQNKCVGNNIDFDGWKQFQIITGANMAGKSTYLRTVGVNMVLAMTGSPVLADSFLMRPANIFTGIKTTDSLQDGESYFFAELKRLKALIDKLESGEKLFVILDEVLRGTNSEDKQKGSMALIAQLIALNASGMIATHDLSLGNLKNEFPQNITNKRFEVEISNGELIFDYKLKDGISQNLNATFLMKKMGITM